MSEEELGRLDEKQLLVLLHERVKNLQDDFATHLADHKESRLSRDRFLKWTVGTLLALAAVLVGWIHNAR